MAEESQDGFFDVCVAQGVQLIRVVYVGVPCIWIGGARTYVRVVFSLCLVGTLAPDARVRSAGWALQGGRGARLQVNAGGALGACEGVCHISDVLQLVSKGGYEVLACDVLQYALEGQYG